MSTRMIVVLLTLVGLVTTSMPAVAYVQQLQYGIDDPATTIALTTTPGIIIQQRYDSAGTMMAWVRLSLDQGSEIYYSDLRTQAVNLIVPASGQVDDSSQLAWSPDGKYILFTIADSNNRSIAKCNINTGAVTVILTGADLGGALARDPFVINDKLVVSTERGIYRVSIDASANPVFGSAKMVLGCDSSFIWPVVSADGKWLLLEEVISVSLTHLWLVDVSEIIFGSAEGITFNTGTAFRVDANDIGYEMYPQFTQDGTGILYMADQTGNYRAGDPNTIVTSNFDVYLVMTPAIIGLNTSATQIMMADNQITFTCSPGGTTMGWVTVTTQGDLSSCISTLYIGSLTIINFMILGSTTPDWARISEATPVVIKDLAGTIIKFPPETDVTCSDCASGDTPVPFVVRTPCDIRGEFEILASMGVTGVIPIFRECLPSPAIFSQPVEFIVHYTDRQIQGLDEGSLDVVPVVEGVGRKDLSAKTKSMAKAKDDNALTFVSQDIVNNTITVTTTHFSLFTIVGQKLPGLDSDHDGLPDVWETMDFDPDTPGIQNPFNPDVADSTGDNGSPNPDGIADGQNDWDGDGMTNAQEYQWHFNPLDPQSFGQLPATSLGGLLCLIFLVLLFAALRLKTATKYN